MTSTRMDPDDPRGPAAATPRNGEPANDTAPTIPADRPATVGTAEPDGTAVPLDSRTRVRRQREQFGGLKVGSCFFGWLAATGMVVVLTALVAAVGAALGWTRAVDVDQASANASTVGWVGAIVLLVVIFVGYYCGGYVAGRMARFHGARQGLGVWLWAVVIAVVLGIIGLIAGAQFDLTSQVTALPRLPVDQGALTLGGVLTAAGVIVVSLVGAILGGLAGMRFHRRVDRLDVTD